ncbi:hypothetical protein [Methanoregula sp. PtaB.Bin085]|uniref:hypothetical protein n=1 Tax=Methanoregula sp. PtaB.Bin085 TaxID=1811680 RepID=UPI0009D6009C|nr:hypothetical protein [Methanoregula sp. PtaB.Bin085]OPX63830.1 MAG: hypothetical protein A4E33_01481 [Methanoregula sp. PtaB.Bin085]
MKKATHKTLSSGFLLLVLAVCLLPPVMADTGSLSIAYRGSGGGYVGDTVVFDGKNTYGNITLIRITGPGLPSEGVPAANLNGPAGAGTPVKVNPDGTWKYTWYSSGIPGTEKLQTWRYTFVATDSLQTDKSATCQFMLKKPEFRITASPNPVTIGNYVELNGMAETGGDSAKIDISDSSGRILHTYTSPVSSSGSFSYSFHVDMGPGQYIVTVNTPLHKTSFGTVLTVVDEADVQSGVTTPSVPQTTTIFLTLSEEPKTPDPSKPVQTTQSAVAPVTVLAGLGAGIIVITISRR